MSAKKVGELLIEQALITPEQRDEALELQKVFPDQLIGQLLCKLGFLKESDLSLVLDQKDKRRKLSEILLQSGVVDPQKIAHALEISKQRDIAFDRALLKLRYVEEEELAEAVASQYDLPYVRINALDLDIQITSHVKIIGR